MPARKPETGNPKPAPQQLPPGKLVLGPLASHPVGEVLDRLHTALGDGDVPGIALAFADNARLDAMAGRDAIAAHFRAMLARAEARRVDLNLQRFERDGERWRAEVMLEIRVLRDGRVQPVLQGRSRLLLAKRDGDGELEITRMERL